MTKDNLMSFHALQFKSMRVTILKLSLGAHIDMLSKLETPRAFLAINYYSDIHTVSLVHILQLFIVD